MASISSPSSPTPSPGGKIMANVMHFGRVLRSAGLPIGTGQIIQAVRALEVAGLRHRDDLYWTLHALFVTRFEHRQLFDQAFHIFWRDPQLIEKMMGLLLPVMPEAEHLTPSKPISRRLAEAFAAGHDQRAPESGEEKTEFDAALTFSSDEILQKMDFEEMSGAELEAAKQVLMRLHLPISDVPTRRYRRSTRGNRIDMRATLRAGLRYGGGIIPLQKKKRLKRRPPLVALCDISGSMHRYSRMFLHFLHAITNDRDRVFTFLFGTRLTNVTRHLAHRDVDEALNRVVDSVDDWAGGTRIGATLKEFNSNWARRVLGQGAVVLLISDGLDRDAGEGLAREMERLQKSCRRLIWLNPLLRYQGFEPKSLGIKAILPFVDDFRTVHNLSSLRELADVLSGPASNSWRPYHASQFKESAA